MAKINTFSTTIDWLPAEKAARYAGLTVDMVNYLCRHGIINPSACSKRGRGCVRKYTFSDILLLQVVAKLLKKGVSVLRLRKSLIALQKRGKSTQDVLSKRYVVTDGYDMYFQDNGVLEMLKTGQMSFAFVLELKTVRKELSEKINRERKLSSR